MVLGWHTSIEVAVFVKALLLRSETLRLFEEEDDEAEEDSGTKSGTSSSSDDLLSAWSNWLVIETGKLGDSAHKGNCTEDEGNGGKAGSIKDSLEFRSISLTISSVEGVFNGDVRLSRRVAGIP